MSVLYSHFCDGFRRAIAKRTYSERRVGAELKFPLVKQDGTAAEPEVLDALWIYLGEHGWTATIDRLSGKVVGARIAGPYNDSLASCETGYCKTEFSLAHVGNLFELKKSVNALRELLRPFADRHSVRFLGYGIQPVTPPSGALLFKKERSSFWDKAVPSNSHIPPEQGDDVHLFTINAGSHVHVSVGMDEATDAVNVLNGLAGPQIALAAHSPVWQGKPDARYVCVNEKLWDWWKPAASRCGVPERAFVDLKDYVRTIENLVPIYVKRNGGPVLLPHFRTFGDYYKSEETVGRSLDGRAVALVPQLEDIRTHNTCYWYTARISQYYTVENRAFDQQPPGELVCAAALTLGLLSALDESRSLVAGHVWSELRDTREAACRDGLHGKTVSLSLAELASDMLAVARRGLAQRGLGEEHFLEPLEQRLCAKVCPADRAITLFQQGGVAGLVDQLAL
ncbi:MAG: hypothetical protein JW888_07460 [Pirellulales bacterium]|nr:hypothetical protein [Pirellulales bacterium]